MKLIPLTKGHFAMVDDADFEWLSGFRWYPKVCKNTIYAGTRIKGGNGKWKSVAMHRMVLGLTDPKILGEHVDMNGLNNTRKNLRPCTMSQNGMNRDGNPNTSSKFKGVTWHIAANKWAAQIGANGKIKHLGCFESEEDAARVYNHFAIKLHGEFAKLNEVSPMLPDSKWGSNILRSHNTSGFRGVFFRKDARKWIARIVVGGKGKHLGYFDNPINAAKSYDNAALEIHGEAARLNFPDTILKI